jgi:hypothetical protein
MKKLDLASPFKYVTVGDMSYNVYDKATGTLLGNVWRSRTGWYGSPAGQRAATIDTSTRERAAKQLTK